MACWFGWLVSCGMDKGLRRSLLSALCSLLFLAFYFYSLGLLLGLLAGRTYGVRCAVFAASVLNVRIVYVYDGYAVLMKILYSHCSHVLSRYSPGAQSDASSQVTHWRSKRLVNLSYHGAGLYTLACVHTMLHGKSM